VAATAVALSLGGAATARAADPPPALGHGARVRAGRRPRERGRPAAPIIAPFFVLQLRFIAGIGAGSVR
jgi:hypothetical protein